MIVISSHLDRVIQDFSLSYKNETHTGLLDNFIGVLVTYLALYDDVNLMLLEKNKKIAIFHSKGEEWGNTMIPALDPAKDMVIVVDVAAGDYYKGTDFTLENIWGIDPEEIAGLREDLKWQGFTIKTRKYTGRPNEDDESWEWIKQKIPVLSMVIPIEGIDDGWHRIQQDNTVSYDTVKKATQGLKRIINYFI